MVEAKEAVERVATVVKVVADKIVVAVNQAVERKEISIYSGLVNRIQS